MQPGGGRRGRPLRLAGWALGCYNQFIPMTAWETWNNLRAGVSDACRGCMSGCVYSSPMGCFRRALYKTTVGNSIAFSNTEPLQKVAGLP